MILINFKPMLECWPRKSCVVKKDLDLIFMTIRLGLIHKHQQYKSPSLVKRSV